jgi:osmotically-inducible protein OsmY
VTLKGTVVTRTQEKAVVDMVGDVVGVKQVRSELTVGEAA